MKAINIITLCSLVILLSSAALGQKRSTKSSASKQAVAGPRITYKGQCVAKGFVIVDYRLSAKCGENSELIVKKPAGAEIVCDTSPVPEGYHVISQEASPAYMTTDSNPLTNALSIVRDGATGSIQPSAQAARSVTT